MASIEGEKTPASVRDAVRREVCATLWRRQSSRGFFLETAHAYRERLPRARDLAWNGQAHPFFWGAFVFLGEP
jgi:CHAT domain-containing protein